MASDRRNIALKYYRKLSEFEVTGRRSITPTSQSKNPHVLSVKISNELQIYFRLLKRVKSLTNQSNSLFRELEDNRVSLNNFQSKFADSFKKVFADETVSRSVADILQRPPCIVIFGQDSLSKATLVKELFGQEIIPVSPLNLNRETQRMVKFRHGTCQKYNLSVAGSYIEEYDFVEERHMDSSRPTNHNSYVPYEEFRLRGEDRDNYHLCTTFLEIKLPHALLQDGGEVFVSSCNNPHATTEQVYRDCIRNVYPIIIYAIGNDRLSEDDMCELREMRRLGPDLQYYFINTKINSPTDLTESGDHDLGREILRQLQDAGFDIESSTFSPGDSPSPRSRRPLKKSDDHSDDFSYVPCSSRPRTSASGPRPHRAKPVESLLKNANFKEDIGTVDLKCEYASEIEELTTFVKFLKKRLNANLVYLSNLLYRAHQHALQTMVYEGFLLSRNTQINYARLKFARNYERRVFRALKEITNQKEAEIRERIKETIQNGKEEIISQAEKFELRLNSSSHSDEKRTTTKIEFISNYESEIRKQTLAYLNQKIAKHLTECISVIKEPFVGVMVRTLDTLERTAAAAASGSADLVPANSGVTNCCRYAFVALLNAAYTVELTPSSISHLHTVMYEKVRYLLSLLSCKELPEPTADWKRQVAEYTIDSLSDTKLAHIICSQFRSMLFEAHHNFQSTLRVLNSRIDRLADRNQTQKTKLRKQLSPRGAKLAIESVSLRDAILYGMPKVTTELGRGQYGVVSYCPSWGKWSPCAVKSIVPPDEKHWIDLSMEFYYARSMAEHERIVQVRGSVIDYMYPGGMPAVLLVMDYYPRDFYTAIKFHLPLIERLQVSCDVVEGLRFLHSQGLIHRDIKLRNILLDCNNRGKITDLGFCKAESMISGSIVGTPIHMSPELSKGSYDNSVDTYAFGILFWYACAGTVRLPQNFENCPSKESLWSAVQKGCRPERLSTFTDECWRLMEWCWEARPEARPHMGEVQHEIAAIFHHTSSRRQRHRTHSLRKT